MLSFAKSSWLVSALHLVQGVLIFSGVAIAPSSIHGAVTETQGPPLSFLDLEALTNKYFEPQGSWRESQSRFFMKGRITDIVEIPVGDIEWASRRSRLLPFYLHLVTVEDTRSPGWRTLLHVGSRRLAELGYLTNQDYCLQYEPLKERKASLGFLLGIARSGREPERGPVSAGLDHVQIQNLDGMLLLFPGTLNICGAREVFTIGVQSADGECREAIDGSGSKYICEHYIGDTLRSSACMVVYPSSDPPEHCDNTTGAGLCSISDYSPNTATGSQKTDP